MYYYVLLFFLFLLSMEGERLPSWVIYIVLEPHKIAQKITLESTGEGGQVKRAMPYLKHDTN